ncbi:hypothetical protein BAL199_08008 [alpha proteobacterium BAL199]|nr:hypothetical protein BAL199_08008 [alpha proteobacterium BAL199]
MGAFGADPTVCWADWVGLIEGEMSSFMSSDS